MKILPCTFLFASLTYLAGCGVTQPVRPLEEGSTEAIASLGGPVIPVGDIVFPVPYLNIGIMHGYKPDLTLYSNIHVTALLFKDVGLDAGVATNIISEEEIRPEVTFNGRMYFFWDAFRGSAARLYPAGTLTASYSVGEHSLFYFGADNLYQFQPSEFFVSPFVGYNFPLNDRMIMQVESKWMAVSRDTRHGVFEGVVSIAGKGNVGLFVGIQYTIEK